MLTVIHGDNLLATREELNRLKKTFTGREIRVLNGRSVSEAEIIQALESQSLFGNETAVIFEHLMARFARKNKDAERIIMQVNAAAGSIEIVIWENREIVPSLLTLLPKSSNCAIKLFKSSPAVFAFLDGLLPGKRKVLLDQLGATFAKDPPELVFSLLVKRVRQLVMVQDKEIPSGLSPWQVARLTSQSKAFTMDELLAFYRDLREFEYSWKSGLTPLTVKDFLFQFITKI